MARSDPGSSRPRARSGSATATPPSGSSSPRDYPRPSPPLSSGQRTPTSTSPTWTPTPTPRRKHGNNGTRQRHSRSLDLTQHLRPTFILSPLQLTSSAQPISSSSRRSSSTSMSALASGSYYGHGYDLVDGEESERPRRAASSPQLVRSHTQGRARSDSASSSASLTATEENYARLRGAGGARGNGHGQGHGAYSHDASSSRFPTTYPALWTFASGQPIPMPMPMPVSPTSPDSSEAFTSPSDEAEEESEDSEDGEGGEGDEEEDLIFVAGGRSSSSRTSSATSMSSHNHNNHHGHGHLRNRRNGRRKDSDVMARERERERVVTTARGQPCAGETETELDEVPIRLPTSRNVNSRPVVPLLIEDIIVPFLFQVTRFLSIVPATFGTLYNLYHVFYPPPSPTTTSPSGGVVKISSIDYVICALWAILTGFQCLFLTTGLLHRWKAYYTTPSTLIRLVALQCICWPATHFTLVFFDHRRRPVACWALIGTTTCISRSVQLWVTSNLYMPVHPSRNTSPVNSRAGEANGHGHGNLNLDLTQLSSGGKVLRSEGRLGPRRWDWAEVIVKCALPAGVLYFVTSWGMILRDELEAGTVFSLWR